MRKNRNVPAKRLLTPGTNQITFTVQASEAVIEHIFSMLLFSEIPGETEKVQLGPLPWETPEETAAALEALPLTREELHNKAKQLTQQICDDYIPGMDNVKLLLTSFGVPRFSALSDDKLPRFISALEIMPMDPAQVPAFIEVFHASEALI